MINTIRIYAAGFIALALIITPSSDGFAGKYNPFKPKRIMIKYSTGTGFFVSRAGHIITNAHVVKNCKSIELQGAARRGTSAKIIAKDSKYDLAILKASVRPSYIGKLRSTYVPPRVGENLMVLGYPGDASKTGKYVIKYSKVKALHGLQGEEHFLQFEDSAQQGNSGGALVDLAGNVVGVVTAKAQLFRRNNLAARNELVSSADIAITLPVLQKFLKRHAIMYQNRDSLMLLSRRRMEEVAKKFTVNILCKQSEQVVER